MKEAKILVILNSLWNLVNFRKNLIKSLLKTNYKVVVVAPFDNNYDQVIKMGCKIVEHNFNGRKTNIFQEFLSLYKLNKIIKREKPSICMTFTIKPNIYASLCCKLYNIPIINNITGLGSFLERGILLKQCIKLLYKYIFGINSFIFFQNNEDMNFFKKNFLKNSLFDLLPGSGVDLKKFNTNKKFIKKSDEIIFILVSRLLWSKGIYEFYNAASLIKKKYSNVRFKILGSLQEKGTEAVDYTILKKWENKGVLKYLGFCKDVKKHLLKSDCLVLPTFYNEGTPKVILEASALKIPIITTNIKGCNHAVINGENGFLCEPKNYHDLALKIEKFIKLSERDRKIMGKRGRFRVEKYFDENIVIKKYEKIINDFLNRD